VAVGVPRSRHNRHRALRPAGEPAVQRAAAARDHASAGGHGAWLVTERNECGNDAELRTKRRAAARQRRGRAPGAAAAELWAAWALFYKSFTRPRSVLCLRGPGRADGRDGVAGDFDVARRACPGPGMRLQ
jgi:hypothetical protein